MVHPYAYLYHTHRQTRPLGVLFFFKRPVSNSVTATHERLKGLRAPNAPHRLRLRQKTMLCRARQRPSSQLVESLCCNLCNFAVCHRTQGRLTGRLSNGISYINLGTDASARLESACWRPLHAQKKCFISYRESPVLRGQAAVCASSLRPRPALGLATLK